MHLGWKSCKPSRATKARRQRHQTRGEQLAPMAPWLAPVTGPQLHLPGRSPNSLRSLYSPGPQVARSSCLPASYFAYYAPFDKALAQLKSFCAKFWRLTTVLPLRHSLHRYTITSERQMPSYEVQSVKACVADGSVPMPGSRRNFPELLNRTWRSHWSSAVSACFERQMIGR